MAALIDLAGPEATYALGRTIGGLLEDGDFIALSGDLGAGKTLLARAIAEGLGCPPGQVQSPTFTLVNTYAGGRLPLHHADFYRLGSIDELYGTGFFDLLGGPGALLVEWPERIPSAAPSARLDLGLSRISEEGRRARLVPHGDRAARLLARLLACEGVSLALDR